MFILILVLFVFCFCGWSLGRFVGGLFSEKEKETFIDKSVHHHHHTHQNITIIDDEYYNSELNKRENKNQFTTK